MACTRVFSLALILGTLSALFQLEAGADVRMPAIVGSGMVLQRGMPLPIWGWADSGEAVTVSIAGQSHATTADDDGRWRVTLDPLVVGPALTMTIAGNNQLKLTDILVGEVWICSGQSNMQWTVGNSWNADLEVAKADHAQIRLITVSTSGSQVPLEDFDGRWERCTPATAEPFSAVGYFFGLELLERLDVPIGLINNAWGGSACEAWVRRDLLEKDSFYRPLMKRWEKIEAEFDPVVERAKYDEKLAAWKVERDKAQAAGKPIPRRPGWRNPLVGNARPGNLFNCRNKPVMPFGIRGAIWYQGESNAGRAYQYRELFPLMIRNWREDWAQGDFPFYWVQLADFLKENDVPKESAWAELREAQTMTLDREPNTGEAVIIDLGEASDIHPKHKIEVGRRLARWALARDYGVSIAHASPRYHSIEASDGKIVVTLSNCGDGVRAVDNSNVLGFAIAGADKQWRRAEAKIIAADRVEVSSDNVADPVAVRYAWADNPICNLISKSGLPVTPFRSDDWPGVTAEAR